MKKIGKYKKDVLAFINDTMPVKLTPFQEEFIKKISSGDIAISIPTTRFYGGKRTKVFIGIDLATGTDRTAIFCTKCKKTINEKDVQDHWCNCKEENASSELGLQPIKMVFDDCVTKEQEKSKKKKRQ